jgi:hypothetical protein
VPREKYNWNDAIKYCSALSLGGFSSGWRLPSGGGDAGGELGTIVDLTRNMPTIDTVAFPDTPSDWFWAATPYAGNPDDAWGVHFDVGNPDYFTMSLASWVRCVR